MKQFYFCFGLLLAHTLALCEQDSTRQQPDVRYLKQVSVKMDRSRKLIDKKTQAAFAAYEKKEKWLYDRIRKVNPEAAKNLFEGPLKRAASLE